MLRSDRTMPLSVDVVGELRDALRRRQKELPARWLATVDAAVLRDAGRAPSAHPLQELEHALCLSVLNGSPAGANPRAVVCIQPSASGSSPGIVGRLAARGAVGAVAVVELEPSLATEMLSRVAPDELRSASVAIACDTTVDLPVPERFPRPRIYLCLGNVLGRTTALGAVRLLRVLRATMRPGDRLLLGVDVTREMQATPAANADETVGADAARHVRALELLDATLGGGFDPRQFEYRSAYDAENARVETHLVARRAFALELPGVGDVRFRKGESLRTSVRCAFDRHRLGAMLAGVGLSLGEWTADAQTGYAVAVATPAT